MDVTDRYTAIDYLLGGVLFAGCTYVVSIPIRLVWNIQPFWRLTWIQSWVITTLMWASWIAGIEMDNRAGRKPIRW